MYLNNVNLVSYRHEGDELLPASLQHDGHASPHSTPAV